ncbi:MAG: ribonuclease domain-containing protein [Casimicrobiaceae bacterium]
MDVRERRRTRLATLLVLTVIGMVVATPYADARAPRAPDEIRADALPPEAQQTLARIRTGSRLPYERDGVVFGNRERLLPAKPRGYYHEYTVRTPGAHNRGARRIVCGGENRSVAECYYSGDHYRSFERIRP